GEEQPPQPTAETKGQDADDQRAHHARRGEGAAPVANSADQDAEDDSGNKLNDHGWYFFYWLHPCRRVLTSVRRGGRAEPPRRRLAATPRSPKSGRQPVSCRRHGKRRNQAARPPARKALRSRVSETGQRRFRSGPFSRRRQGAGARRRAGRPEAPPAERTAADSAPGRQTAATVRAGRPTGLYPAVRGWLPRVLRARPPRALR